MSEERHQQRQQRLKEQVDARVAAAQDERGIVIVFYRQRKRENHRRIRHGDARRWTRSKKWA